MQTNHQIVAVLTQPDRPSGRGMQLKQSPVKQYAVQHGLTLLQPATLKSTEIQKQIAEYNADLMIVAAYGLILPETVLSIPRHGCLNIHASLLPRWRGAAPIQRAIQSGDAETGITIMQMDAGLDTGDILLKKTCNIETLETAETLHAKLAVLGAEAITEALVQLEQGKLIKLPQDNNIATYATKLTKEEAQIDWHLDAITIDRNIRAFNPYPGAGTSLNNTHIKIWQSKVVEETKGAPGEVVALKNGILVACGKGSVRVEILQKPNAKAMAASQFLQGFPIKAGDRFKTN